MNHKNDARHEKPSKRRMMAIAGGSFFLLLGFSLQHQGKSVWTNYYGQNVFSVGIIVVGGLIIVLGLLPNSWVAKAVATQQKKPVRFHHNSSIHSGKD